MRKLTIWQDTTEMGPEVQGHLMTLTNMISQVSLSQKITSITEANVHLVTVMYIITMIHTMSEIVLLII